MTERTKTDTLQERLDLVHNLVGLQERISETLRPCSGLDGEFVPSPLVAKDETKANDLWAIGFKAISIAQQVLDGIGEEIERER